MTSDEFKRVFERVEEAKREALDQIPPFIKSALADLDRADSVQTDLKSSGDGTPSPEVTATIEQAHAMLRELQQMFNANASFEALAPCVEDARMAVHRLNETVKVAREKLRNAVGW